MPMNEGQLSEQLFWRWVNLCEQKWIRLSERQRESARFDALIAEPDYLHVAKRVGEHPHNAIGPENARPPPATQKRPHANSSTACGPLVRGKRQPGGRRGIAGEISRR